MYKNQRIKLAKLKSEVEFYSNIYKYLEEETNDLTVGCRVKATLKNGTTKEGRVVEYDEKRREWRVLMDDQLTYSLSTNSLINLSLTTKGKIEKRIWLFKKNIREIEAILKNADVPEDIKDLKYLNIKVISVKPISNLTGSHSLMYFENNADDLVRSIQLPFTSFGVINPAYFQLQFKEGEVSGLLPLSEEKYYENKK